LSGYTIDDTIDSVDGTIVTIDGSKKTIVEYRWCQLMIALHF